MSTHIFKGPILGPIPECSLGEYLLPKIKSLPQDRVIQVESDTGTTQTVAELLAMGIRVAEGLKKLGLKAGDIIAMWSMNCLDTTAVVLGSWLCAGVITPMPPNMTIGEIKYALDITQPRFLFCEEEAVKNVVAAIEALAINTIIILLSDSTEKRPHIRGIQWKIFREILPEVDVGSYVPTSVKSPSTEPITILFSSGTSGLPKAVGITHKNFVFQAISMNATGHIVHDFIHISHFFWVTAHLFLIRTLTTGMKRVLVKQATLPNILKAIEEQKPKWTMITPVFAISLGNCPDFSKYDVSSLKLMLLGGSLLTPAMAEKIKDKWKGVMLKQCYGTTEVSGTVSVTGDGQDIFSLGRLTPGVQAKIVDVESGKTVKPHSLGEICVKSQGVMKGYLKNEAMTKEALDEGGWFRTGDMGYFDDKEQLYLVDRLKELVKMMGMQVAPTEVEDVILQIPGVQEAAVVGVTENEEVWELLAMVVRDKDSSVTEKLVQDHVATALSPHKHLTAGVLFVDSLPKTSSGKLEKKQIRKMAQDIYLARMQRKKAPPTG